jgi:predicted dehydrogenase
LVSNFPLLPVHNRDDERHSVRQGEQAVSKPTRRPTRRDFLKKTATTAAAVGMPYVIPSGVLAMPGRPGPNDRIVYGHIGIGGMGSSHIVADSCAALCDVDKNHLDQNALRVKERGGKVELLTNDYRRVLERKDIDAVTIGTPDHWHAIMTVEACQAGKHVYSEKPTCRTIQEGLAMVNAARKYNKAVQIGAQGRSNPTARAAAQFVRNGQLGRVHEVEIWHPNNFVGGWGEEKAPPPNLDWNLWLGPMRWREYNPDIVHFNFRWVMDSGGGFVRDRGNHALSLVSWCMGVDTTGPDSVEATGKPNPNGVWDAPVTMNVKWEFKNPDWVLTWNQPGMPRRFPGSNDFIEWGAVYKGDRDTLLVSGGDGGCDTEQKAKEYKPPSTGVNLFLEPEEADPTERHRRNWRRCIKTGEKPAMDVAIGANVITLPIIANIAYLLGRKLHWDHKNLKFVGDEEANRMLAQPYRAPWHL